MNAAQANATIDPHRRLQRALWRAAKARATRRFHALYDKMYREDILARAWPEVKANAGAAGPDRHTSEQIEQRGVEGFRAELATELREGCYRPRAVRRVGIPKANGGERPLGIPAVRDRVVQAAAKVVLEPIFEADFRDSSYGFRPKRGAHQAGEQIRQAVNRGTNGVVDADIAAFFDRIDHAVLLKLVERRISDRRMLKLLGQWLKAGVLDAEEDIPSAQGVPQGGVSSPLLANVVRHERDRFWEDYCSSLGQLSRSADDCVIRCRTEGAAREALRRVGEVLTWLGLTLHPEKTPVVFGGDGRQGFDVRGFHWRKVESWRYRGRRYLHRWPSRRARQRVRERIRASTAPRYRLREPAQPLVDERNRLLRGWGTYFRVGNSSRQFPQVDDYVRQRLALFLSKKTGRRGRCWERHSVAFFRALGVYQLSGTVTWYRATPTAAR